MVHCLHYRKTDGNDTAYVKMRSEEVSFPSFDPFESEVFQSKALGKVSHPSNEHHFTSRFF